MRRRQSPRGGRAPWGGIAGRANAGAQHGTGLQQDPGKQQQQSEQGKHACSHARPCGGQQEGARHGTRHRGRGVGALLFSADPFGPLAGPS
jgi:hypothetical protein